MTPDYLNLATRFPGLEHLEVEKPSAWDYCGDHACAQLSLQSLTHLTQLKSVDLENCTQVSVAGLASLVLACPQLNSLTLPQVRRFFPPPLAALHSPTTSVHHTWACTDPPPLCSCAPVTAVAPCSLPCGTCRR